MRRTVMTLTAVGVLFAAAACGQDDSQFAVGREDGEPAAENASARRAAAQDQEQEQGTTTTSAPGPTTSTTAGATTTTVGATAVPGATGGACGGAGAAPAAASLRRRPADAPPECLPPPEPEPESAPEPELGTGDVQVTLRWESRADVDLHVTEPDGTEIWYQNRGPSSTGGELDVDSNVGCVQGPAVENVYWPPDAGPAGGYTVQVVGFQVDGCGSGAYTLTVKVRGSEVLRETGSVGEDETDTYEFEV